MAISDENKHSKRAEGDWTPVTGGIPLPDKLRRKDLPPMPKKIPRDPKARFALRKKLLNAPRDSVD